MKGEDKDPIIDLIHAFQRTFVISRQSGAPAEGMIPFNPLNFHLISLLHAQGELRPTAITQALDIPKTTLSTALSSLIRRGLLIKTPDPSDGRASLIRLSEAGQQVAVAIQRQEQKISALILQTAEPHEREDLLLACQQLSRVIGKLAAQSKSSQ